MYRTLTGLNFCVNTYRNCSYKVRPLSAALPKIGSKRHEWTKEEDKRLLELIAEKGRAWTEIAAELGIQGSPLKARRRWEVLQPKEGASWNKSEDKDLEQAVKDYTAKGKRLGGRGSWVTIASMLKTNRSPRQCSVRWKNTLLPRQGVALKFTRFQNIRAWGWTDGEISRLCTAIASITNVQDSDESMVKAEEKEPWLLPVSDSELRRCPGYWSYIASKVGTRTPDQCTIKWRILNNPRKHVDMSIDEIKNLVKLVKEHGNRWGFLAKKFFPNQQPVDLQYVYVRWKIIEKQYNIDDMLAIDPFSRLQDYNGETAMRPTDKYGRYDPNGKLIKVKVRSIASVFTPYHLAYINAPRSSGNNDKSSFDAWEVSENRFPKSLPPHIMDKLVAAILSHRNDWIAISREVGIPMHKCYRYAKVLGSSIMSIQSVLDNPELEELASRSKVFEPSDD
ncbi:hypothetical protein GGI25_005060 [Coemansia spiralis]|uniref:Uncharacterized protein n=2 Tax=Coemansia TaxID=4863 RepID=A0A9W8G3C8_9FUNG|nr:hypothetical protein EDC05_004884 [Coemansia umbellata]KAJ2620234.1 hypothetical protein GGI26_005191 [Coemansia sp. RSA 1358]KAJ2672562.1 hypothetical protein GGI25_005060 [Coemansia spiralis]